MLGCPLVAAGAEPIGTLEWIVALITAGSANVLVA